jgi:hypothetical protein
MAEALVERAELLLQQFSGEAIADEDADRRAEQRVACRILLSSIALDPRTSRPVARMTPAWSVDVSKSGAAVVTRDSLRCPRVYLKFLLPGAGARCLECEVVHAVTIDEFEGERGPFHRYGVRFVRSISESELQYALESISGR